MARLATRAGVASCVASSKRTARDAAPKQGVAHHRSRVAERRVLPASAADVEEGCQVVPSCARERRARAVVGRVAARECRRPPVRSPRSRRRRNSELPGDGRTRCGRARAPAATARAGRASSWHLRAVVAVWLAPTNWLNAPRQTIAERRQAQHGVDVGQVVVHPRAVHADDRRGAPAPSRGSRRRWTRRKPVPRLRK